MFFSEEHIYSSCLRSQTKGSYTMDKLLWKTHKAGCLCATIYKTRYIRPRSISVLHETEKAAGLPSILSYLYSVFSPFKCSLTYSCIRLLISSSTFSAAPIVVWQHLRYLSIRPLNSSHAATVRILLSHIVSGRSTAPIYHTGNRPAWREPFTSHSY